MKKIASLVSLFVLLFAKPVLAVMIKNPDPKLFVENLGGANTFGGILAFLIEIGLGLVGILSMAFIIFGGIQYITSRGDEEQATAGRKTLTNAIIGLVIVIFSWVIVATVINALK